MRPPPRRAMSPANARVRPLARLAAAVSRANAAVRALARLAAAAGLGALLSTCAPPELDGTYRLDLVARGSTCPDVDVAERLDDVELVVLQNGAQLDAQLRVIPILAEIDLSGSSGIGGAELASIDTHAGERIGACRFSYAYRLTMAVDAGDNVIGVLLQEGSTPGRRCHPPRCTATFDVTGTRVH